MWAGPQCLSAAPEERPLPAGGEGAANSLRAPSSAQGGSCLSPYPTCPGWEKGRGFLSRFSFTVPLPGMEMRAAIWPLPLAEGIRPSPAASQGLLLPRTAGSQHRDTSSSSPGLQAWFFISVQGYKADPCPGEPASFTPALGSVLAGLRGSAAAGWTHGHSQGQFAFYTQLLPTDFTCTDTRGQTGSVPRPVLELNLKALSHCSAGAEPGSAQPGDPAAGFPVRAQLLPLDSPQLQRGPGSAGLEAPALLLPAGAGCCNRTPCHWRRAQSLRGGVSAEA